MVPPNGPSAALSTSTWIHWWSPVASANASTRSWVISSQSVLPRSSPTASASWSVEVKVRMARTYRWRGPSAVGGPRHRGCDDRAVGASYAVAAPHRRTAGQPGTLPVEGHDDRLVGDHLHLLAADHQQRLLAGLQREGDLVPLDVDPDPGLA